MAINMTGIASPAQIYQANVASIQGLDIAEEPNAAGSFADIFNNLVAQADEQYNIADAGTQSLLSGETDDLAQVMIDASKAETSLNLVIQIRNKVLDAYNEVMRMSL